MISNLWDVVLNEKYGCWEILIELIHVLTFNFGFNLGLAKLNKCNVK
jgi:hypothetical protein